MQPTHEQIQKAARILRAHETFDAAVDAVVGSMPRHLRHEVRQQVRENLAEVASILRRDTICR